MLPLLVCVACSPSPVVFRPPKSTAAVTTHTLLFCLLPMTPRSTSLFPNLRLQSSASTLTLVFPVSFLNIIIYNNSAIRFRIRRFVRSFIHSFVQHAYTAIPFCLYPIPTRFTLWSVSNTRLIPFVHTSALSSQPSLLFRCFVVRLRLAYLISSHFLLHHPPQHTSTHTHPLHTPK